jgi:hypothetical protein
VGTLTSADALVAEPLTTDGHADGETDRLERFGDLTVIGDGPVLVREKEHDARPMSIDQALYEMELVGHDFFLFVDEADARPSVVYKRRGYTYGVIRLSGPEEYRRAGGQ